MLDGDGSINNNAYRHFILDDKWESKDKLFTLEINDFDYTLITDRNGLLSSKFYFDIFGDDKEFNLCLYDNVTVIDNNDKIIYSLNKMYYKNELIYIELNNIITGEDLVIELFKKI